MKFAKNFDLADLKSETDKLDIDDLKTIPVVLTHFRPMFHLCKNQLPGLSIRATLVENGLSKLSDVANMKLLKRLNMMN